MEYIEGLSAPGKTAKKTLNFAQLIGATAIVSIAALNPAPLQAQQQKPNIIFIMGDDIGWNNIGVYNQGIMSGRTPNLDRLANEGMRFTDYYPEASCTAGRANFITGELPIRTGLTTVGRQARRLECQTKLRRLLRRSNRWVMPQANSAKIIWAT